jgi:hypothetical protein
VERAQTGGVFFLDPDNRAYVEGTRPWYYVGTGPATAGCSLTLLFVVPLVSVPFLWYLIATQLELRSVRQNAISVSARIVALDTTVVGKDADGDPVEGQTLKYAFEAPEGEDGRRYERQVNLSGAQFTRLQGRQTVEVIYPRGDPSSSRMLSEVPGADWGVAEVGLLGCGGVLPILVPILVVLCERGRRQRLAGGNVLRGEVVTCAGEYDDDNDFMVTLTCHFRTPQGREVELTRRAQRNDLSPERLPAPGTAVLVRYHRPEQDVPAVLSHLKDLATEVL